MHSSLGLEIQKKACQVFGVLSNTSLILQCSYLPLLLEESGWKVSVTRRASYIQITVGGHLLVPPNKWNGYTTGLKTFMTQLILSVKSAPNTKTREIK